MVAILWSTTRSSSEEQPMSAPSYESTFAHLTQPTYNGGMEPYFDTLRLLVAMLRNEGGLPTEDRLAELAYHLDDAQRGALQRIAAAAGRLDDATIAAEISVAQFRAQRDRRFGTSNPELMDVPFWRLMVQRGWIAYRARMQYDQAYREYMEAFRAQREREEAGEVVADEPEQPHPGRGAPIWCFSRFGMSLTRLPDGRALFIAGEHEDYYDTDFCIYNDVIVIDPELRVTIYGYPTEVFPPTDFHTATLVGETDVYLIGSLGYREERRPGETPIYRLDTTTMQISPVTTTGVGPGWIFTHRAAYDPARNAIRVSGGQIVTGRGRRGIRDNRRSFWLSLKTMAWSRGKLPITRE
jgi:hypothetical protein